MGLHMLHEWPFSLLRKQHSERSWLGFAGMIVAQDPFGEMGLGLCKSCTEAINVESAIIPRIPTIT